MRRKAFVEGILSSLPVVEINLAIGRVHAELVAELTNQGRPISPHDLWIAATAKYFDYAVITTNASEFDRVSGLSVVAFPETR